MSGPVIAPVFTVMVEGTVRATLAMSWGADMSGGLPAGAVSMGTGIRSWTGRITWAPTTTITHEAQRPRPDWFEDLISGGVRATDWPPRNGDTVTIDATVDGETWRVFTGRIGETQASLDGGLVSTVWSTIGDRLRSEVTIAPTSGTSSAGLPAHGFSIAVQAFEQARMGLVPPVTATSFAHASFQAGFRAIVGSTRQAGLIGGDTADGLAWGSDVTIDAADAVGVDYPTVVARARPDSVAAVTLTTVGGRVIRMQWSPTTDAYTLTVDGAVVATAARTDESPYPILAFRARSVGIDYWTGRDSPVRFASRVISGNRRAATVHVENLLAVEGWYGVLALPTQVIRDLTDEPVRTFRNPSLDVQRVGATRGFEGATAASVIDAWSTATLNAVWETETGAVIAASRPWLITQTPVRALVVEERVFSGEHLIGGGDLHRQVIIHGEEATLEGRDGSPRFAATVSEPTHAQVLPADEQPVTVEWFVNAPTDEDWGPIDTAPRNLGQSSRWFDTRFGSIWAANAIEADQINNRDGTWVQSVAGTVASLSVERLGQRTLKFTATARRISGYFYDVFLRIPPANTTLSGADAGRAMPVIRAQWKTVWSEWLEKVGAGPSWAADFHWSPGWWLLRQDARAIAERLAEELLKPLPAFTGVDLLWDPSRRLGDMETWESSSGWVADVLITSCDTTVTQGVPSQRVDAQIVRLADQSAGKTYRDLARAYARYSSMSGTYEQVREALPDAL